MRAASQKTKLAILLEHVDEWRARVGSREAVALEIVEKHIAMGMNDKPRMEFSTTGDAFTRGKNAADRIFRWLDDKTKDGTLMPANFELSILTAMPEDLRISYLNDFMSSLRLTVRPADDGAEDALNATAHLVDIVKESGEAAAAVADLIAAPTPANLKRADKELVEAQFVIQETLCAVRATAAMGNLKAVA